ncbi:D-alanine--D-alanyl carrier protein ligase [Pseudoalteromonas holothuriae]|uniref:D-alanine--D-alanyl carrier protein ligase n=1 Tax=Pseudoalteromonas holothuriae TaxID=2963714 RepID=A0ABN8UPI5_9GAMM|nr:non-ribosomal peptide synthetase/type I polyketide synthase [Pseudoalteromonas sp. CIP111951]CAH9058399.1 D-alanine--D-alanyl carrier protein ligase [Pseudoalteromonas sp. CIP111951]
MNTNIVTSLVYLAKTRGNDVAYQYFFDDDQPSKTLTYFQLDKNARLIASHLKVHFRKGDRALLLYNSGFEFVEAFFACLYAGVVAVPAYPPKKNQNIDRLRSIIEDAGAAGALTTAKINEIARPLFESETSLKSLPIYITDLFSTEQSDQQASKEIDLKPNDLAFLQYTSGSTGSPKGVMVDHHNIINNEQMMKVAFGHNETTPIVSWLPHFHDMGLIFGILHPIYIGAPAVLMNPTYFLQKPFRWLKLLSDSKGITSSAPNFAYDLCVDTIKDKDLATLDLSNWRRALNGAEPVRASTLERFYQKFKSCGLKREALSPCYGMAETTLFATGGKLFEGAKVLHLDEQQIKKGNAVIKTPYRQGAPFCELNDEQSGQSYYAVSCGVTWHDHNIAIVNPQNMQRLEDSKVGEIWVKGESVARGYWQQEQATEATFNAYIDAKDGPYLRTGDLGFVCQNELYVTGRCKDVLIFRGKNYYPQDIELSVTESHSALDNNGGAAFSVITDKGEEGLVVVQQVKRTVIRKLDADAVFSAVTQAIVQNHGVTPFELLLIKPGRILKTSSGKIQRQENKQYYLNDSFEVIARSRTSVKTLQSKPKVTVNQGLEGAVLRALKDVVALELDTSTQSLDIDATFQSLGIDSMKAVRISGELMEIHDIELEATVLFEYPSIAQLTQYLCEFDEVKQAFSRVEQQSVFDKGKQTPSASKSNSKSSPSLDGDIAVIGMACRYPQADNIDEYWQLLIDKQDAISAVGKARQELCPQLNENRLGGYLQEVECFDPAMFSLSPTEATYIDPQHRLLLETSYHAIEAAGYKPAELAGQAVGVYVGISQSDYFTLSTNKLTENPYLGTGTALSIAANRLSYTYDFTGPSVAVDTACSSSLVALHHAMQALRSGKVPVSLVAGVNLILSNEVTDACQNAQMLAPDGHCKTFSDNANGYVRSEGVGCLVIKPLAQALADNDPIYGILKGSAINQDGRSNGLTAPSGGAQQKVLQAALDDAQLSASDIQYVEAHGTGTKLGDPIEVTALNKVYGVGRRKMNPLIVGSAKANIGHLESGAGIAGLIKTLLCLEHGQIPGQPYTDTLNSHIPWHKIAISVNGKTSQISQCKQGKAFAGVSSFGFGGTNAHVICQNRPSLKLKSIDLEASTIAYILPLTAKTSESLSALVANYKRRLETLDATQFDALIHTTAHRPNLKGVKTALVGLSRTQLLNSLANHQTSEPSSQSLIPQNVFLFTGQGVHYAGMGRSLYESHDVFKSSIDECDELLANSLGKRLIEVLYDGAENEIEQTKWAQVAIFVVEYALAKLLLSFGVTPDKLLGHSVGEYAAACIAGVFSLADAIKLISSRALLMHQLEATGTMVSARCDAVLANQLIAQHKNEAAISAYHGHSGVVFSGSDSAITAICTQLNEKAIKFKKLNTARAFHSPLMIPMLAEFKNVAESISFHLPCYDFISSVTGQLEREALCEPQYWVEQIVQPVKFADALNVLKDSEYFCVLEIGPKAVLSTLVQENLPRANSEFVSVLNPKGDDKLRLLSTLARLFEIGAQLDWQAIYPQQGVVRQPLPAYPFAKDRYWIGLQSQVAKSSSKIASVPQNINRHQVIKQYVLNTLATLLSIPAQNIDIQQPLLEMGVDSLMIMQAVRTYEKEFTLEFSVRQFYEELSSVSRLVEYIEKHSDYLIQTEDMAAVVNESEVQVPVEVMHKSLGLNEHVLESICKEQLQAAASVTCEQARLSVEAVSTKQLQLLQNMQISHSSQSKLSEHSNTSVVTKNATVNTGAAQIDSVLPGFKLNQLAIHQDNEQVKIHQQNLANTYCQKTTSSKALVTEHRAHLSDCRASAGFRLSSKEMLYPVFAKRSQGARIWDIDDNEYIDITMDFGVNLFGHKSEFITQALYEQIDAGLQLGLASPVACDVAELISELTGLARVTFCNSGTEAVMTAVRLARTVSKRDKIVQFNGAYHGHYDGTLAHPTPDGSKVEPMCSGIRQGTVADNIVLDYGADEAISVIRANANSIAAVLVEPVQSRHPELQPWAFLHALREVTTELGIALIFDEMITGFRAHPGGVQAMLGIRADMATYGKVVGGGLPIGVVAGSAKYLDAIDGGTWQYGDKSYPKADTTFFAGTFCKHPLAMASAKAVLNEIKKRGAQCQADIADKTTYLKSTLNTFFEETNVPIKVESFTSLFRFRFNQNLDVFFYEMLNRGVFIWEGRNCFLSDAHTNDDVEAIIAAVKGSVVSLQSAGYFGVANKASNITKLNTCAYPLSQAQQQLLALGLRTRKGALAYHLQGTVKLSGQLDVKRLSKAIETLHKQIPVLGFGVDPDDLCHRSVSKQTQFLRNEICQNDRSISHKLAELRYESFDFQSDRLCRFTLIKTAENTHYLTVVAHHLLYDGIAITQLISAVAQYYNENSVPDTHQFIDYRDYIDALASYRQSSKYSKDEQYWLEQLSAVSQLTLPARTNAPSATSYEVRSLMYVISQPAINNLSALSKGQGCGQFATLLAIYILWLNKLTRQNVVSVLIPVSDRQLLDNQFEPQVLDTKLVGYCTNILPIVVDVSSCQNIAELIKVTQKQLLNAFDHQHFPFSALADQNKSLPTVMFNLDKVHKLPDFNGLMTKNITSSAQFGQFELSCNIACISEQWSLQLDYNCAKFDDDLVNRYAHQFIALLNNLSGSDKLNTRACSLLEQQDYQAVLLNPIQNAQDNHQKRSLQKTLLDDISASVRNYPHKVALRCNERQITYADLDVRINQMAHYLTIKGVKEGDLVAIALSRRSELLISLIAVLKIGAAYLPLDLAYPKDRIIDILDDAQVSLLICDSTSADSELLQNASFNVLDVDNEAQHIDKQPCDIKFNQVMSDQVAYVIYTSGSTGRPKGVEVMHSGLSNLLEAMRDKPGVSADDKFLSITTIAFDIAMLELFLPLTAGAMTVIADEQICSDPDAIIEQLTTYSISIMQATPTLWRLLLNTNPNCVKSLKVLCGGEPLDSILAKKVLSGGGELWNMYGPTETTIWSSVSHINNARSITIGEGIANTSLYIMDEDAQNQALPLPIGVWGELWIGGLGVAKGYINRADLTLQRFVEHQFNEQLKQRLYKTGDRARRLADGQIELQGRLDQQVKLNGHRIELGEIEYHIANLFNTTDIKALIVSEQHNIGSLCVYSIDAKDLSSTWTLARLRQILARYLPNYMLPEQLFWLTEWPKTANGKLNLNALPVAQSTQNTEPERVNLPSTQSEQKLLHCYLNVLQVNQFCTKKSFFDGGGNSVQAMQLVSRINREFGIRITVADVFDYPSVSTLSQRIEDLTHAKTASGAAPKVQQVSDIVSGRDINDVLADQSMTEMDL